LSPVNFQAGMGQRHGVTAAFNSVYLNIGAEGRTRTGTAYATTPSR